MARTTRAIATATKRAMVTNSDTTGNGYHCLSSSAVVGVAVGKDDKGSGGLFLYGVVVKRNGLCIFSIMIFGKKAICLDGLFFPPYSKSWVLLCLVIDYLTKQTLLNRISCLASKNLTKFLI
jgi:hypothetical protein